LSGLFSRRRRHVGVSDSSTCNDALLEYPIPLYLNQKYVFDILAMMENGFSQLEAVHTSRDEQTDRSGKFSGDVGLKNSFAFLGVSWGKDQEHLDSTREEVSREKYHTPNSLFAKMRQQLVERHQIRDLDMNRLQSGMFVEFKARLHKNPMIDSLEGLRGIMRASVSATAIATGPKKSVTDVDLTIKSIEQMLVEFSSQATFDLIGETVGETKLAVVLTIDRAFVSDPTLADLVDGEYTVLGKVTRVLRIDSHDEINILRKTGLGRMSAESGTAIVQAFNTMAKSTLNMSDIEAVVRPPALQVVPLAIFA